VNSDAERRLNEQAAALGARMSDERLTNQTRGLVPMSLVFRWFFDQSGEPLPDDYPRAVVKVSHLWGFGEKRRVGLFTDGFGDGFATGWAAMVELAGGGQPIENYRVYRDRLRALQSEFERLLPPEYPFSVDTDRARSGAVVFANHCARCHGEYRRDAANRPIFQEPQFTAYDEIGTDDDRLKARTPTLLKLIGREPWRDDFRYHDRGPGYLAPRLEGVWARFPYLHNGGVPTLRALLTEPSQRPRFWSVEEAGEAHRFDESTVGLTLPDPTSDAAAELERRAVAGSRDVYFVERVGHSNRGHEFGLDLSDGDKTALIEYLKTL
jgi:hypothetical protein